MPAKTQIPGDRVDIAAFATQTAIAEANTPSQSTGSLEPTLTPVVGGMHAVEAAATQTALAPTPIPIVTSRGPHLEASDPKTVSMASGGLQFVEFFEFW